MYFRPPFELGPCRGRRVLRRRSFASFLVSQQGALHGFSVINNPSAARQSDEWQRAVVPPLLERSSADGDFSEHVKLGEPVTAGGWLVLHKRAELGPAMPRLGRALLGRCSMCNNTHARSLSHRQGGVRVLRPRQRGAVSGPILVNAGLLGGCAPGKTGPKPCQAPRRFFVGAPAWRARIMAW